MNKTIVYMMVGLMIVSIGAAATLYTNGADIDSGGGMITGLASMIITQTGTTDALYIDNSGTGESITIAQNGNARAIVVNNAGNQRGIQFQQSADFNGATDDGMLLYSNFAHTKGRGLLSVYMDNSASVLDAAYIQNDGTARSLEIVQDGVLTTGNDVVSIYSNGVQTTGRSLLSVYADNSGTTIPSAVIRQDGTGIGLLIDQNGAGNPLNIQAASTDADAVVINKNTGAGRGIELVNAGTGEALYIDQNGNSESVYIDSEATNQAAVFIDANQDNNSRSIQVYHNGAEKFSVYRNDNIDDEALLRLGNKYLWIDSTGDLRVSNTYPTSDTDGSVVGTQT